MLDYDNFDDSGKSNFFCRWPYRNSSSDIGVSGEWHCRLLTDRSKQGISSKIMFQFRFWQHFHYTPKKKMCMYSNTSFSVSGTVKLIFSSVKCVKRDYHPLSGNAENFYNLQSVVAISTVLKVISLPNLKLLSLCFLVVLHN